MSYEDELGEALRRAGEGFSTDQTVLIEAGHARGRRMARRRRAAVFGGAVTVVALGVTSAVVLPAMGGERGESAAPVASTKGPMDGAATESPKAREGGAAAGGHVSREELIATLKSLLPAGKFSEENGLGTDDEAAGPYAAVAFDDGKGKAAVQIAFTRLGPSELAHAKVMTTCPDRQRVPYDFCEVSTEADGSRLMVHRGYKHGSDKGGTKFWQVVYARPDGRVIDAGEFNSRAEAGSPVTRAEPPLSTRQLTAVVRSAKWDPVFEAPLDERPKNPGAATTPAAGGSSEEDSSKEGSGKDEAPDSDAPPTAESQAVRSTLIALLPKGLKVIGQGGEGEYAYVVVDDGKGASLVQINVQPGMDDVRGELFAGAEELPGGVLYKGRESGGDKGVEGSVMWTADTIRMDGLRVVVSAFNAGRQSDAPSRAKPALSQEQLKSLATDKKWAEVPQG
ncbi:hypothetical protein ACIBI4_18255 [Streptomyces sp. NPDC050418]|uniref:hypothetical protein n=1 Tax=Streptomyces sp. NPDC050418 TaxID=3365612 RepID=UPI0037970B82